VRLWSISLRNLRIRAVATALTMLSIVLATALYAAILTMSEQTEQRYKGSIGGFQAVVGPKDASQLEVVLNTIFNVDVAPGLFPLQICSDLRAGKGASRRSQVRYAIPQARGDSVSRFNFPVVATIDEMFSKYEWNYDGERTALRFLAGGPFRYSYDELLQLADGLAAHESALRTGEAAPPPRPLIQPAWKQAVVGARVARQLGLELGGTITPVHGKMGEFEYHEHPEATCAIVGILAPTNSPLDTTIFLPIGLHYLIEGHEGGSFLVELPPGKNPDDAKKLPVTAARLGLTAVLLDPKDHFGARILRQEFSSKEAQVAWPQDVIPRFLQQIGNAADALAVIAWLVLLVAAIAITVAIYNTMNERRREIAIMRSLGARRSQILAIIVGEAALLSFFGGVLGLAACHVATFFLRDLVEDRTGVYLDWLQFRPWEAWLLLGVTLLGGLAGLLPAIKGSMTQVADNLAQNY
jgi:putative ABC transport system permease protein